MEEEAIVVLRPRTGQDRNEGTGLVRHCFNLVDIGCGSVMGTLRTSGWFLMPRQAMPRAIPTKWRTLASTFNPASGGPEALSVQTTPPAGWWWRGCSGFVGCVRGRAIGP